MILLKPYLTEKTLAQNVYQRFAFVVNAKATKHQVKDAVEKLFKVNVLKVSTRLRKPISSRSWRTGNQVTKKAVKIAYVQLKDKQTIDLFKTK